MYYLRIIMRQLYFRLGTNYCMVTVNQKQKTMDEVHRVKLLHLSSEIFQVDSPPLGCTLILINDYTVSA